MLNVLFLWIFFLLFCSSFDIRRRQIQYKRQAKLFIIILLPSDCSVSFSYGFGRYFAVQTRKPVNIILINTKSQQTCEFNFDLIRFTEWAGVFICNVSSLRFIRGRKCLGVKYDFTFSSYVI